MGCYINPQNERKEAFLGREGTFVGILPPEWGAVPEGSLPVCLVDNGLFTAAGIAYCAEEMAAFAHPDSRPKRWFTVPAEKLLPVSPLSEYLDREKSDRGHA